MSRKEIPRPHRTRWSTAAEDDLLQSVSERGLNWAESSFLFNTLPH